MLGRAPPRPTTATIRPSVTTTTGSSTIRPVRTSSIRSAVMTTESASAGAGRTSSANAARIERIDFLN
jgi:hypothetical protein